MNLKKSVIILAAGCMMFACTTKENPFFNEFQTPFGTPPFEEIKMEH